MTMLFVIKHYYKINELILKYIIKLKEHNIYEENISKKNLLSCAKSLNFHSINK